MDIPGELSPEKVGAEVLAAIATSRASGTLLWERAGGQVRLTFNAGRPAAVAQGQGEPTSGRAEVVGALRAFACAASGSCSFGATPSSGSLEQLLPALSIDTLGETLVAVVKGLTPETLAGLWQARAGTRVVTTPAYEKLLAAATRLGCVVFAVEQAGFVLGRFGGLPLEQQRTAAALLFLGGLSEVTAAPAAAAARGAMTATATTGATAGQTGAPAPVEIILGRARAAAATRAAGSIASAGAADPRDPRLLALLPEIEATLRKLETQNDYELLGVAPDASTEAIRKSYFELAKRWHADRFAGIELGAVAPRIEEIFRRIGEAYGTLANPEERKAYDVYLDRKAKGLPTDSASILKAEALFKKAQGLVRRGQAAAALPLLKEAVGINTGEAEFWAYLGFALYSAKGSEALAEARAHLEKAIEMRETLDAAHEFLGRIARIEGEPDAAARSLKRALELNKANHDAERELRLISMRATKRAEAPKSGGLLGSIFKK